MNLQVRDKRFVISITALLGLMCLILGSCQGIKGFGHNRKPAELKGVSSDKKEPLFDYREITLNNGLRVITLEDFSCPIVTVQLWYHVGSKDERPDRQGFAHMFEHMMFRGTDRLGPTDHFGYIRRTGGQVNGYTSFDRTVYLQTLPADQLELALWLEAERMTFLKIDQESFDIERKVVEEERRVKLNKPYGTADEKFLAEVFKVHPYRWTPIGKIRHLRAATVGELRDFWSRYYVPNNAVLIIIGAVSHEQAQQQAKRYFGWIPRYDEPALVMVSEPPVTAGRSITIEEDIAPAGVVGLGWRTVPLKHKDTIALDLLADILGGGNSSRLYRELVAEKQLAVGAQTIHYSLEQDGLFGAGAVLAPGSTEFNNILETIESQIEGVRTKLVSEQELTKARNQMLKGLVAQNLTINGKANMLGNAAVVEGQTSRVNRLLEEIRSVTIEDLLRVGQVYLAPERALKVTVVQKRPGAEEQKEASNGAITAEPEKIAPAPGREGLERPEDLPKVAPVAKLVTSKLTPNYSSTVLANGLKVIVVPNHEVPFVTVQLGLLAGAWTESKPGTTSMTMKMLTKGTKNYTEGQLAEELETYAISLDGLGRMDTCTINVSCLGEHIDRAMKLLGEVVLRPTFPEDEFAKLQKQVLTSLAIDSAKPAYIADKQFRGRLYGEHPYGRIARGEITDVEALTVEDFKQWWGSFARPDTAVVMFAGDIERDRAVQLARKELGNWKAAETCPEISLPKLAESKPRRIYLVDRPGSIQSQIRVGQLGITRRHPDYFVSRLVSSYFGWGLNSRLNENIRVKKGLTYGIWGSYVAQRFAGRFEVSTFSKTEATGEAVRSILAELEKLTSIGPSQKELEHNRSYILGSFVRDRETPQQIAGDLWLIESHGLGADYLDRLLEAVASTQAEDCQQLIEETLDISKIVIVVVGDAAKLKEELEEIGPVTVVSTEKPNNATAGPTAGGLFH